MNQEIELENADVSSNMEQLSPTSPPNEGRLSVQEEYISQGNAFPGNASVTSKNLSMHSDATSSEGGLGDTSSSALDQDLLDQQPLNCCERIPLWLKLLVIASVSLLGILVIGTWLLVIVGVNLDLAVRNNYLAYMVEETENANKYIEKEAMEVFNYGVLGIEADLQAIFSESDVALARYSEVVMKNARHHGTKLSESAAVTAQEYLDQLPLTRYHTINHQISVYDKVRFYTRFYLSLLDVSMQMFTSRDIKQSIVQQNILTRIRSRDLALKMVLGAVKLTNQNFTEELLERFIAYRHQRDTNINLFKAFGSSRMIAMFENEIENTQEHRYLTDVENYVFQNRYEDIFNVSGEEYFGNASLRTEKITRLMREAGDVLYQESNQLLLTSVLEIIFVAAVAALFFAAAIVVSFVMARTIIGPWKRMLKLQEITIQRFVPSQFVILMKCKKIRELTRGKSVQRDITVMCITISNFPQIMGSFHTKSSNSTESVPDSKIITFLNQYLEYMSEVIRNHNGYVHKFERETVIACLKSPSNALSCALKYQKAVDTFNKIHHTHYPVINVTIGIHHLQNLLVATVGETDRIHGTFLNEDFDIAKKLESLAYQHDVKIMTTIRTLGHVNKNTKKLIRNRMICKLITTSGEVMDCVEICDRETANQDRKLTSAKIFSSGVEMLYKANYLDALLKLQSASKICSDKDPLILYLIKICQTFLTQTRNKMMTVTLEQTLHDPILLQSFVSFCMLERSQENIDLWDIIDQFKSSPDIERRKVILTRIKDEYLNENSNHSVNLSNEVKQRCMKHLMEIDVDGMCSTCKTPCTIMSNTLFDSIKDAIELVMTDTFRRFQKSESFRSSFMSSNLVVQPNHLYFDMREGKVFQ